jgi:hypothetical protein
MLPNGHRAFVDMAKLVDYCLNASHEDGKHKARVFLSALGLRRGDAALLRRRLLEAAVREPATVVSSTRFGALYTLEFPMTTSVGSATIKSGWIIRYGEDFPRLITCYVKTK